MVRESNRLMIEYAINEYLSGRFKAYNLNSYIRLANGYYQLDVDTDKGNSLVIFLDIKIIEDIIDDGLDERTGKTIYRVIPVIEEIREVS